VVISLWVGWSASRCVRGTSSASAGISPPVVGLLAAAFPWSAYLYAQSGLLLTMALSAVIIGGLGVIRGHKQGAVKAMASAAFVAIYLGFLSSFALLIRLHTNPGHRLISAVLVMLMVLKIATMLGSSFGPSRKTLGWRTSGLAIAGALLGALMSVPLVRGALGLTQMALLGVIVGSAAAVGLAATDLIAAGFAGGRPWRLTARLAPILLALPAFFYGFRLYLS